MSDCVEKLRAKAQTEKRTAPHSDVVDSKWRGYTECLVEQGNISTEERSYILAGLRDKIFVGEY